MRVGRQMTVEQADAYGVGLYEGMVIVTVSAAKLERDPDRREALLRQARGHWWAATGMRMQCGLLPPTYTPDLYLDNLKPHVFSINSRHPSVFDSTMRSEAPVVR